MSNRLSRYVPSLCSASTTSEEKKKKVNETKSPVICLGMLGCHETCAFHHNGRLSACPRQCLTLCKPSGLDVPSKFPSALHDDVDDYRQATRVAKVPPFKAHRQALALC